MPEIQLGIKQRAALLALMAAAKDLSNNELRDITGFSLTGKPRQQLNDEKLLETNTTKVPHVHSLTEQGWAWCTKELSADVPKGAGSAGGALYAVLAGLNRYLSRTNLKLADVFQAAQEKAVVAEKPPVVDPAEVEGLIRRAYKKLRKEPRAWVSLTALRPLLVGLSKDEVDAALYRMNRTKGVNIIPQSNQKVLSAEDRNAMIRIGNEDKLLLSIDEP